MGFNLLKSGQLTGPLWFLAALSFVHHTPVPAVPDAPSLRAAGLGEFPSLITLPAHPLPTTHAASLKIITAVPCAVHAGLPSSVETVSLSILCLAAMWQSESLSRSCDSFALKLELTGLLLGFFLLFIPNSAF